MENAIAEINTEEEIQPIAEDEFKLPLEPRFYEFFYIIKAGLEENAVIKTLETVRNLILEQKGIIIGEKPPQISRLAYKINKITEGGRGWFKFMIKPEETAGLKERFKKIEEITRFSLSKIPKESSKISKKRIIRKPAPTEKRTEKKEEVKEEELDKKLEEILG
ncbi:MAG: 30S ribosomal protein S6 [Candidatus Niyogibacteria bacterium]|nr:30S ribosomal protein S6 [Candidatus Niyogibacteria bacterium]